MASYTDIGILYYGGVVTFQSHKPERVCRVTSDNVTVKIEVIWPKWFGTISLQTNEVLHV